MKKKKVVKSIMYNTIGSFTYLLCQWLMTFIVVWVSGYKTAGILSISMSVATTFAVIATFNMRNYRSSDLKSKYSEKTYLITRLITSILAVVITLTYSIIKNFNLFQLLCINVFMLYKVTEAIVDVLHGTLQKKWRFDIIGKSFFCRGIILIILFYSGLKITNNLLLTLLITTIFTYIFIFVFDIKNYKKVVHTYGDYKKRYTLQLLIQCVPMVIYGLLFSYISLYPKIIVENYLGAEQLGYYASVSTPALIIQVAATFIFTPLLSLFAEYYQNREYKKFKVVSFRIILIIIIIGLIGITLSKFFGKFGLTLLFGKSIIPYISLFNGVIIISTLIAIIWFLGMLLVVKRNYKILIIGSIIPLLLTIFISKSVIYNYNLNGINVVLIIVYSVQAFIYLLDIIGTKNNAIQTKSIFYLRSTSIINDSRASKEILSLINNNYDVYVIGWDRDNRLSNSKEVLLNHNKINGKFFKFKAPYGDSKKTLFGLVLFQLWLFYFLVKNNKRYNIIHACDFDCGFIATIIKILFNKKLVYDMYDYYSDSRPMPKKIEDVINNLESKVINNSDLSIICAEWRKKQIKGSNPKKLIVIHNTPEIDSINGKRIIKSTNNKLKVGYVGILQEHRLIKEVLDAFVNNNNYELHIGGFGKYENEIRIASDKYNNIFYYGSLCYDDVLSLERDCDLLFATYDPIIKNHKYSAPNKIYEAMALSKPIIVCKDTGINSIIDKNDIGISINYNIDEFMKVLKKLDEDRKKVKMMGINSNKLYKEKYNWKKMEEELIDSYKDIMKEVDKNDNDTNTNI